MLNVAVIGLGQAGSRFDEEPRGSVWSHVGAYLSQTDEFILVGGVDVGEENRNRFALRCPAVPCFYSVPELLAAASVDVVSIATPYTIRKEIFEAIFQSMSPPKLIICEKPLADDANLREWIVRGCRDKGIFLTVHYNRRYMKLYQRMREMIQTGELGDVYSITVRCPNRLWSIGSHAINLLLYLTGEVPNQFRFMEIPALREDNEAAVNFMGEFPSGVSGQVIVQGRKRQLIFEVEAVGSKGRLLATGNGARLVLERTIPSSRYMGYDELGSAEILYREEKSESTFVAIVRESVQVLQGSSSASDGDSAMLSENVIDAMLKKSLSESEA